MTFVDSGAWFAQAVPSDPHHGAAVAWAGGNHDTLITTDYVIDETLTLFSSRGDRIKAVAFGTRIFNRTCPVVIHYLTPAEIAAAWEVFRTFVDKGWSFTDCTSKVVIETLGIPTAFAFDQHFLQFGTVIVVP